MHKNTRERALTGRWSNRWRVSVYLQQDSCSGLGLGQGRPVLCLTHDKGGVIAARDFRFSRCLWALHEKGLKCVCVRGGERRGGYSRAGNVSWWGFNKRGSRDQREQYLLSCTARTELLMTDIKTPKKFKVLSRVEMCLQCNVQPSRCSYRAFKC